jgi:RNA polymerase sigma-70 factor, ECF subfamily
MRNVTKLSDEEMVREVCNSDKELYSEIIRRYQSKLMRYASYLMRDETTGADVVQNGFIKAYINLRGFDTKKKFSSWLYRIIHNEAMNALGKDKNNRPINEYDHFESNIDIEDDVIKKELTEHTYSCLNEMTLLYREPLSLYYLEEKSYEEISDILHIPIGTVATRINRAKGIMKKLCQIHKK